MLDDSKKETFDATFMGGHSFQWPKDNNENIIDRTINGEVDDVNYGKVNDRHFINITSFGFDADVAHNAWYMKKYTAVPNNMIYLASIFYSLYKFKNPHVKISFNDMTLDQQITMLAVCNGKYYGNGVPIAPNANYKDDLFNICLADKINKARIPFLLNNVLNGKHEQYDFVHTYQTDHIKVEADEIINCNVDGEMLYSNCFEIGIVKNKMKVLRPKKTTY